MKIQIYFRKLAFLTLLFALFQGEYDQLPHIAAQTIKNVDLKYPAMNVIRVQGWNIPVSSPDPRQPPTIADIEGISVTKRILRPDKALIDFESFYGDSAGIKVSSQKCRVRSLVSFEKAKKTFAYEAVFNLVDDTRPYESLGAVYIIYFIDYDGDGLFEQRIQTPKLPALPAWIKSSN